MAVKRLLVFRWQIMKIQTPFDDHSVSPSIEQTMKGIQTSYDDDDDNNKDDDDDDSPSNGNNSNNSASHSNSKRGSKRFLQQRARQQAIATETCSASPLTECHKFFSSDVAVYKFYH
eukprot:jgi/Psemu1/46367/gm1.46367_g